MTTSEVLQSEVEILLELKPVIVLLIVVLVTLVLAIDALKSRRLVNALIGVSLVLLDVLLVVIIIQLLKPFVWVS